LTRRGGGEKKKRFGSNWTFSKKREGKETQARISLLIEGQRIPILRGEGERKGGTCILSPLYSQKREKKRSISKLTTLLGEGGGESSLSNCFGGGGEEGKTRIAWTSLRRRNLIIQKRGKRGLPFASSLHPRERGGKIGGREGEVIWPELRRIYSVKTR